jgi:hypothetical protein
MRPLSRIITLLAAVAFLAGATPVQAQSSRTPACGLLTAAEVRTLTGNKDYPNQADGEVRDDGRTSTCQYGGASMIDEGAPLLSVVLTSRKPGIKNAAEFQRTWRLGAGCKREDVSGVGDDAVYETCPDARGPILYATKGTHDLMVQLDAKPATAATKATVIAVAKGAAAKVK